MLRLIRALITSVVVAIAFSSTASTASAGPGDVLSLEQIVTLHTVAEARIAPDGRDVVYVVGRESVARGKKPETEIWIAPTAGGPSRRLLTAEGAETEPRWSPDGASIAYLASRGSGGRQIHLARRDGQDERALGEGTAGAARPEWSPDGRFISFIRTDVSGTAKKPYEPIVSGADDPARIWVVEVATGLVRAVTARDLSVARSYAWSPDSQSIVFAAEPLGEWIAGRQTLHVASVATATTRVLAPLDDRTIGVAWSPDGKHIAWCGREHTAGSGQLVIFDAAAPGAQKGRTLHADFPASMAWIGFLPGGHLALAALRNMRVGLYSLSVDGGPMVEVASPDAYRPGSLGSGSWGRFTISLTADGRRFATTHSGPAEPGNVVTGEWGKPASLHRLTNLDPEIERAALGETEEISWKAPDGLEIFGLVIKPVGYQPGHRYPTVVEAHGGPRRSFWDTCNLNDNWGQILATRGYLVLLPNPRGSEGRGPEFVRAGEDEGGGDLQDILAGLDHLVKRGDADPDHLGIGGWSYGGFMTAWAITQTPRFKAAVVGAGMVNRLSGEGQTRGDWRAPREPYDHPEKLLRRSPITYVRNVVTPTLIVHGANDNTVPTAQSIEHYTALRALGVPTEHVLYPGETHIFTDTDHMIDLRRRVVEWFDRYLKPGGRP
jgi:dipeptidyl aminopeptidase/acylaminoacyl peptidase